ncbi:hypothetical protein D3C85_1878280 [compost metagenome]
MVHHHLGNPERHDGRGGDRFAAHLHFDGHEFTTEALRLGSKVPDGLPQFRN